MATKKVNGVYHVSNTQTGGSGDDPNAVKYVEQELTAAQQGQARANIGSASVADLQNIQSEEYVPVTTLPTASASTLGKIYLVGPDANNEYAKKITSFDGTSYSWVDFGTTQLDLSGYATEEELNQLSQKVDDIATKSKNVYNPENEVDGYALSSGDPTPNANYKYNSEYIPCTQGQYISYYGQVTADLDGVSRIAFYDSSKTFLSQKNTNFGAVTNTLNDVANSAYIRIMCGKNAANVMVEINDANPSYTVLPYVAYGSKIKEEALPDYVRQGKELLQFFNISDNIYNPEKEVSGYNLVSGDPSADARFKYDSEYIPATNGQFLSFKANTDTTALDGVFSITSYNSQKQYIKRDTFSGGAVTNKELDAANLAYIRITCGINASNIMVVLNDSNPGYTDLPYVPFGNGLKPSAVPEEITDAIEENATQIEEIKQGGLKDYQVAEMKRVQVKSIGYPSALNFIWQSDQHLRKDNENIEQMRLVGEIADTGQLDFVMLGGDVVDGVVSGETLSDFYQYMFDAVKGVGLKHTPVWLCKGNHETNFNDYVITGNTDGCVTNEAMYRLCFGHLERDGVVFPAIDYPTYFYKDFPRQKVRVIVLNTSDNINDAGVTDCNPAESFIRQDQIDWLAGVALDLSGKEDASEWAVVTMSHASLISSTYGTKNANNITYQILKAFADGSTWSGNNGGEGLTYNNAAGVSTPIVQGDQFYLSASVDFRAQGAIEYMGHIQGHFHYDGVIVPSRWAKPNIYVVNSYPSQKAIGSYGSVGFESYPRTPGTVDEYAFDIVCIDRASKSWRMTRYGAGGDRTVHYEQESIQAGATKQLTTALSGTITWSAFSDGNNKVTVNSSGLVTANTSGYAAIVRAENENYDKEYWLFIVS